MEVNNYKYQKPNEKYEKSTRVFLKVIKTPHWLDTPSNICKKLPVGALTWTTSACVIDKNKLLKSSIIIENNQFTMNFDPTCFEVLHTSVQKLKK